MFNVQILFPIAKIYKGLSSDDRTQVYLGSGCLFEEEGFETLLKFRPTGHSPQQSGLVGNLAMFLFVEGLKSSVPRV